jgi:hypothetical protein
LILGKTEADAFYRIEAYHYDPQAFTPFVDEVVSRDEDWEFYQAMLEEQRKGLTEVECHAMPSLPRNPPTKDLAGREIAHLSPAFSLCT